MYQRYTESTEKLNPEVLECRIRATEPDPIVLENGTQPTEPNLSGLSPVDKIMFFCIMIRWFRSSLVDWVRLTGSCPVACSWFSFIYDPVQSAGPVLRYFRFRIELSGSCLVGQFRFSGCRLKFFWWMWHFENEDRHGDLIRNFQRFSTKLQKF